MTDTAGTTGQPADAEPIMLRWVFGRDDARVDVYRSSAMSATQIDVSAGGEMRAFRFLDRQSVVAFHAGIEHALLQTGWHLMTFEPERRGGSDRRTLQRGIERRGFPALVWSR
jgi:hypothetical protein